MSSRRHDNRGAAPYARSLRVNQVIRQVLAEELERLADADDRLELVTVTGVEVDSDLRHAMVYLSSLNEGSREALGERRVHLQRLLGRQVRMKRTPLLTFEVDPAVEAGGRVEDVLRRLRDSRPADTATPTGTGTGTGTGTDADDDADADADADGTGGLPADGTGSPPGP